MNFLNIVSIAFAALFAENIVFNYAFGTNSVISDSDNEKKALGTGAFMTAVTTISSIFCFLADLLLNKWKGIEFLRTLIFMIITLASASLLYEFVKRLVRVRRREEKRVFMRLAINSAILGALVLTSARGLGFFGTVVNGLFSGLGFTLAIMLFAAIRVKLRFCKIPKSFEGLPILLITAGLLALVFMGFNGISFA